MKDPVREVRIHCTSVEEKVRVAGSIHNQLVGNQDYIDDNIVLNMDDEFDIFVWIGEEVEMPVITLKI